MKAIILAAGKGIRMLPLTLRIPKPLLRIGNKTVLDYIFDALPAEVDQVIVVVGFLKKQIQQYLGNKYQGRLIRYVVQDILDGSGTALLCCRDLFLAKERFIVIYGDDLATSEEIQACLSFQYSWLCCPNDNPRQSSAAIIEEGIIRDVIEKPDPPPSSVVMSAAGIMVVDSDIFGYAPIRHPNGEYYLTSLMTQFLQTHLVRAVFGRQRPAFISPDELDRIIIDSQGRPIYK